MKTTGRAKAMMAVGTAIVIGITGCSSEADTHAGANEKVTIVVGDRPPANQAALVSALDQSIKAFEKANPNIYIKSVDTKWDAQSFQALLAGGTLPNVMGAPFTEPQSLIKNKQVADITKALKATGLDTKLNKKVLTVAQSHGVTYGVPTDVYSIGLAYNRKVFSAAGLDPNTPPTTWAEVQQDAKKITQATNNAGYATYTADHYGGWMTTAATYSLGGRVENASGSKATLDTPALKTYLTMLQQMRWSDNSMGSNFLYSADPALQDFAAGKIGMILGLPQDYPALIENYKMDPADYAFTAMPKSKPENYTLSGGVVQIFSPKSSEAQIEAGIKWIEFNRFEQYFSKTAAVANAQATLKDKGVVGLPALTPLNAAAYTRYQNWITPYVNVPLAQFAGYSSVANKQTIVPEPVNDAQDLYAQVDSVLQAILTNKNTDLDSTLQQAQQTVNKELNR